MRATGDVTSNSFAAANSRSEALLLVGARAMAPALANASPELAKVTKKAMTSYEATRAAVMNADQVGQRIGGAVRREFA